MTREPRQEGDPGPGEAVTEETRPPEPICVRIATAVDMTGIGRSTLYELINAGEVETVKVGRSTFIRYDSLKRLFERR